MSNNRNSSNKNDSQSNRGRSDDLRASPMMDHLLTAMEEGTDIGHYGRLTFAMVSRHFIEDEELVSLLAKQPDMDEQQARAMVLQVNQREYNPPGRDRILEWQEQQDFPICPTPEDPNSCNVYRELSFPEEIYSQIQDFWEERVEADGEDSQPD